MVGFIDKEELKKSIISSLNLESLSEEYQNEILQELETNISKQLQISIFNKLTEDERKEFEAVNALSVTDESKKFLEGKIPNFQSFALDVAKKVIEEFKNLRNTIPEVVPDESYEIGNPDA